jgi:hypothetical protein
MILTQDGACVKSQSRLAHRVTLRPNACILSGALIA